MHTVTIDNERSGGAPAIELDLLILIRLTDSRTVESRTRLSCEKRELQSQSKRSIYPSIHPSIYLSLALVSSIVAAASSSSSARFSRTPRVNNAHRSLYRLHQRCAAADALTTSVN